MTKFELLRRLELIESQMEELEQILAERTELNKINKTKVELENFAITEGKLA